MRPGDGVGGRAGSRMAPAAAISYLPGAPAPRTEPPFSWCISKSREQCFPHHLWAQTLNRPPEWELFTRETW